MVVRKFNYKRFAIVLAVFIAIIVGIVYGISSLVNDIKYKKTYEYKFSELGYTKEEIKFLTDKFSNEKLELLLKREYNTDIIDFAKEKYFIYNNLDKYIEYRKESDTKDLTKIVAIINTQANVEWLDVSYETDTSKNEEMLVNRLYGLSKDYEPEDLISAPLDYSLAGVKISQTAMDAVIPLIEEGKKNGYTFILTSGYRSYKEQEKLYNSYADSYGMSEADEVVAKPGHSEYQTGLSFDLEPYGVVIQNAKEAEQYLWFRENAYKLGFIFRFDENKKDITLFPSYTWRLRYVGKTAASLIYSEQICYEEYYAYFVEGK